MVLEDKELWQYFLNQDLYIPQEFGIGVIGIGALLIGYAQTSSPNIKLLIALIGMSASFILWMHMFGARKEREQVQKVLEKTNIDFFKKFNDARSWRHKGIYRFIYYPVTLLMIFFMGLVTIVWFTIILRLMGLSFGNWVAISAIVTSSAYAIYVRIREIRSYKKSERTC